ncbi:MAG: flagellar filament capping protein FliD [Oscillospiraceae bacterium]|jgi:flagellar hook-associated protein 2|nr:flagellar filament capping protein FliD [Oscillospiraceae bacterium]
MAVNSLNLTNMNRITGLQSGLDTDALIKNLMKAQQAKYDKMVSSKTRQEWKRDAYVDLNNTLRKFKDEYASFTNAKSNMTSVTAYKSYAVEMAANASLSATATANAREGTYTISVERLAKGAVVTGGPASININGFSASVIASTQIGKIASFASGQTVDGEIRFSVNGTDFTFQSTDSLKKVMDTVSNSSAGVTMSYSQVTNAFTFETKAVGAYQGLPEPTEPPPFTYVYDGTEIEPPYMAPPGDGATQPELDAYAAYQTQLGIYEADFAARRAPLFAAYQADVNQYNQDLAAYRADQTHTVSLTDDTGFLNAIGVDASQAATPGQTALLTVNGVSIERDGNEFELDGVTLKLTGLSGTPVSLTVKQDVQKSVDMVKSLVDAYNTLISDLFAKVIEKKNTGYAPLTSEQREELGETDAALWDAKAKAGLLGRDATLRTLVDSLQRAFADAVGDRGVLSGLGISGDIYRVSEAQKIVVDEEKLRQALTSDPDKVYHMFTDRVEDAAGRVNTQQSGLMTRLTAAMDAFVNEASGVNGGKISAATGIVAINRDIDEWTEKIQAENTRLYNLQESYYKKFAAMETALAKMQSQTDALASFGLQ